MTILLSGWGKSGAVGGGIGKPPALVLSLVTLHNVWKSWYHRFLMGIKHGYLFVNVVWGTTTWDPPFTFIYNLSREVVGRMLEFREWVCKWEGHSFLGVKSKSILFVYTCESVKGYLPSSLHYQDYLLFQYHLDIEILVTDCHTFGFTWRKYSLLDHCRYLYYLILYWTQ